MIRLPTSTGLDSVESPFVVFSRPWIFLSLQTLKKPSNARSWAGAKALALRAQQGSLDTRFFDEVFPETNITHMDVSKNKGKTPIFGWFIMENLILQWMIWGENPLFSETYPYAPWNRGIHFWEIWSFWSQKPCREKPTFEKITWPSSFWFTKIWLKWVRDSNSIVKLQNKKLWKDSST